MATAVPEGYHREMGTGGGGVVVQAAVEAVGMTKMAGGAMVGIGRGYSYSFLGTSTHSGNIGRHVPYASISGVEAAGGGGEPPNFAAPCTLPTQPRRYEMAKFLERA